MYLYIQAHKLKNAESGLAKSLTALPARKRILLSGTPMQNELSEFFNMVDFCNPGVLGTPAQFRKSYERPILQSREPDASESQVANAARLQKELSTIVNEFILKRGNILNAQHLPPKLVQYVCCKLTPMQTALYDIVLRSKQDRHVRDGKQINTLNSLRYLMLICSHPELLVAAHRQRLAESKSGEADEELQELVNYIQEHSAEHSSKPPDVFAAARTGSASRADRAVIRTAVKGAGKGGISSGFDPELSGKFLVLYRLMCTLRVLPSKERIVIVSNSTQTLDLIEGEIFISWFGIF
jgi:DNA repair and recombination protein RAD54 and RAD54-like protein